MDIAPPFVDKTWEKTTQRRQRDQHTYEKKKENEKKPFRIEVIPWDQIVSELEQGDSSARKDDTEHTYTVRTTQSEGDPRPSKTRRISNVRGEISDVVPEQFCHTRAYIKRKYCI